MKFNNSYIHETAIIDDGAELGFEIRFGTGCIFAQAQKLAQKIRLVRTFL